MYNKKPQHWVNVGTQSDRLPSPAFALPMVAQTLHAFVKDMVSVNLHDWASVNLLGVDKPEDNSKQDHTPKHGNRPVHRLCRHCHRRGPEREEDANDGVKDGDDVDGSAKTS